MDLYDGIMERRSIRKYSEKTFTKEQILELEESLNHLNSLYPVKGFRVVFVNQRENHAPTRLGFLFGAVKINAPHCLIAICDKNRQAMLNVGFAVEELVIRLTCLGCGTCWLGTFNRDYLNNFCKVKENETIAAVIAAGYGEYSFMNKGFRSISGTNKRKPVDQVFYYKAYPQKADSCPSAAKSLMKVMEMSIKAPSANNRQPVKVIFDELSAHFFTEKDACLDAGIFISHFYLCAAEENLRPQYVFDNSPKSDFKIPGTYSYAGTITYQLP